MVFFPFRFRDHQAPLLGFKYRRFTPVPEPFPFFPIFVPDGPGKVGLLTLPVASIGICGILGTMTRKKAKQIYLVLVFAWFILAIPLAEMIPYFNGLSGIGRRYQFVALIGQIGLFILYSVYVVFCVKEFPRNE